MHYRLQGGLARAQQWNGASIACARARPLYVLLLSEERPKRSRCPLTVASVWGEQLPRGMRQA
eukprot:1314296-Pyramimonas_sp.AAC.1